MITKSPVTILVILLSRIVLYEVGRMFGLYWRSASVPNGEMLATGTNAGVRSAKSVGSVAVIIQAVAFCFGAGCGPWCMSFRAQRRKVGRRFMAG